MNSNYISTESLYDSGAHLSHARQYSHKYIKREPDGKGGYRYWYKTDIGTFPASPGATTKRTDTYKEYQVEKNPYGKGHWSGATAYNESGKFSQAVWGGTKTNTQKKFRQADKASKIYREGQYKNAVDYLNTRTRNRAKVSKEYQEELEVNSRKNGSKPTVSDSQKVTTWDNANVKTFDSEYQKALESNSKKNNYFGQGSNPGIVSYSSSTSKPEKKTIGDYAKQAIDTISTAAGSAYDKGKNFLKNLFK